MMNISFLIKIDVFGILAILATIRSIPEPYDLEFKDFLIEIRKIHALVEVFGFGNGKEIISNKRPWDIIQFGIEEHHYDNKMSFMDRILKDWEFPPSGEVKYFSICPKTPSGGYAIEKNLDDDNNDYTEKAVMNILKKIQNDCKINQFTLNVCENKNTVYSSNILRRMLGLTCELYDELIKPNTIVDVIIKDEYLKKHYENSDLTLLPLVGQMTENLMPKQERERDSYKNTNSNQKKIIKDELLGSTIYIIGSFKTKNDNDLKNLIPGVERILSNLIKNNEMVKNIIKKCSNLSEGEAEKISHRTILIQERETMDVGIIFILTFTRKNIEKIRVKEIKEMFEKYIQHAKKADVEIFIGEIQQIPLY